MDKAKQKYVNMIDGWTVTSMITPRVVVTDERNKDELLILEGETPNDTKPTVIILFETAMSYMEMKEGHPVSIADLRMLAAAVTAYDELLKKNKEGK